MHAIPASDAEEYQGMPMFAEAGPLIMDPKLLLKVDEYTSLAEQGPHFKGTIEKVYDS